jgi:hypothetical protein
MNARVIVTRKTSAGLGLSQVVVWSYRFFFFAAVRFRFAPFAARSTALKAFSRPKP